MLYGNLYCTSTMPPYFYTSIKKKKRKNDITTGYTACRECIVSIEAPIFFLHPQICKAPQSTQGLEVSQR